MTTADIKHKARQLGYTACGVIPAAVFEEYKTYLDERVKSFPDSAPLYAPLYAHARPHKAGRTILVAIRGYNRYAVPASLRGRIGKVYLFDGRLPYAREYRAKEEFEAFLKLGGLGLLPCNVPDRWAAVKAGLGVFGRNNFVYTKEHGSYIWIDTWLVDRALTADPPPASTRASACREDCQKCIRACPTKALADSFSMDRGKCVAQLTFHTQELPEEEVRRQMGAWLYGCDICQDVCPMNHGKRNGTEPFPLLYGHEALLTLENILKMDRRTYQNVIQPRFWYIGEDDLWIWQCHALRSMINTGNPAYHACIRESLGHEDARVREIAAWGCARIRRGGEGM